MEIHIHAAQAGDLPALVGAAAIIDETELSLHVQPSWPRCARIAGAEAVLNTALDGVESPARPRH